jgi:hypothetical protein
MDPGAGTDRRAVVLASSSLTTAVLSPTISVLVVTCLNACPGAIAAELAGCPAVGAHAAIALCDHDLPVLDSETIGDCIRRRGIRQYEQYAQSHEAFHREPRAWQTDRKRSPG